MTITQEYPLSLVNLGPLMIAIATRVRSSNRLTFSIYIDVQIPFSILYSV